MKHKVNIKGYCPTLDQNGGIAITFNEDYSLNITITLDKYDSLVLSDLDNIAKDLGITSQEVYDIIKGGNK